MKSGLFKDLSESQKINHFPGTFNIGRKDRLWKNYYKLRVKFGKSEFSFLPRTFCMPAEARVLRKVWEKRGVKAKWIIKPPAVSCRCYLIVVVTLFAWVAHLVDRGGWFDIDLGCSTILLGHLVAKV